MKQLCSQHDNEKIMNVDFYNSLISLTLTCVYKCINNICKNSISKSNKESSYMYIKAVRESGWGSVFFSTLKWSCFHT